jgi:hypothetical protein
LSSSFRPSLRTSFSDGVVVVAASLFFLFTVVFLLEDPAVFAADDFGFSITGLVFVDFDEG